MERTTEYNNGAYRLKDSDCDRLWPVPFLDTSSEGIQKLGLLEDIEEEIGIDLITLFNALKDGIWVNERYYRDDEEGNIRYFETSFVDRKHIVLLYDDVWKDKVVIRHLEFKDYGKTWALTREELGGEE